LGHQVQAFNACRAFEFDRRSAQAAQRFPELGYEEKGMQLNNSSLEENVQLDSRTQIEPKSKSWAIGLTGFFFILLQSACAAFMALSGLRLVIGLGSLAAATAGMNLLASIHGAVIRIPMEIVAIAGSVINLYAIWRVRSLRARPSSQWRVAPVTADKKRAESIQIAIAILTLLLVVIEWAIHIYLHHSI
jgi:hypothetical protein